MSCAEIPSVPTMSRLQTLGNCLNRARAMLPFEDAIALTSYAFSKSREELIGYPETQVCDKQVKRHTHLIERRCAGEPIAYICGYRYFWTFKLAVSPAVLIPRPETEILVENIIPHINDSDRVLDLATGSGAIALAIASEKKCRITASDCSQAALDLTRTNANSLQLELDIVESNWYERIEGRFNAIVCNPPYVAEGDKYLTEGDLRFEPQVALTSGPTGLEALKLVIENAPDCLESEGWLAVEHGFDQADEVLQMFHDATFTNISAHLDLAKLPRVVMGQIA